MFPVPTFNVMLLELIVSAAIDCVILPLPPVLKVTLVLPFKAAPRLIAPLLTLDPVVVVLRDMVDALMALDTLRPAVVGVVPGAIPFALTTKFPHVPDTVDNVSVLFEMYCKLRLLPPAVVRPTPTVPLFPFLITSACPAFVPISPVPAVKLIV